MALALSYSLLLQRFSQKSQELHMHLPKPRSTTTRQIEREKGRYRVPWQEGKVGIDPTGWNERRVVGDGDPARSSGAVLEKERERRSEGKR